MSRPLVAAVIPGMFSYRFDLLDQRTSVVSEHLGLFRHDEAAMEHATGLDHAQVVRVWRGWRLVADLPTLSDVTEAHAWLSAADFKLLRHIMALTLAELDDNKALGASLAPRI